MGSRAQAQYLWCTGSAAPRHMGSSQIRDPICVFCISRHILCHSGCSVALTSDSLQPHRLQHARLPCPSLSPKVCSNSCPSSRWLNVHQDGHEFEHAPGVGYEQGSLVCYSPWGHKESDMMSDWSELSQWCYLTISISAALFCFCLQSFPASRSFPMS